MDIHTLLVNDYLDRVLAKLRALPLAERNDFRREIASHIQEAYAQMPGEDGAGKMLAVLRNLGEPAEIAAGRLPVPPEGKRLRLPLRVLGVLAGTVFGIPASLASAGLAVYLLAALTGILAGLFAVSAGLMTIGSILAILGITRIYRPDLWDLLVTLGEFRIPADAGEALEHLSYSDQGLILFCLGLVFAALSFGVFKAGQQYFRAYRFVVVKAWRGVRWAAKQVAGVVHGVAEDLGLFTPKARVYQY